jgi:hypothetical protein
MTTKPTEPEVDLERGSANVERILHATAEPPVEERRAGTSPIVVEKGENVAQAITRTRAKRSDAGKPREPVVRNTEFQWRVEELMQAEAALTLAKITRDRKWAEYCDFVDKALAK